MKKRRILIMSGGYAEIPLIKAAKKANFEVITSGNRPDGAGHKFSDIYANGDFSSPEAMLAIAKAYQVDAVAPSCNDFAATSAAYVAEKLGLPGHDSYEDTIIVHHKDKFRDFCLKNNFSVPKAMGFSDRATAYDFLNEISFPVIVKPVDLTGGKGIERVNNKADWKLAIDNAFDISKASRIVIEEFIEGTNHGFSCLIEAGKVAFYFTDDEYYYLNPYLVAGTSSPGTISKNAIKDLITFSEDVVAVLALKDGLFHVQLIIRDDKPYIIEVCRRPPGDLYPKFVEYATGVDYSSFILKSYSDTPATLKGIDKKESFFARHCIMGYKAGKVLNVEYAEEITPFIFKEVKLWKAGDILEKDFFAKKLAILFMKFDSESEMKRISNNLYDFIKVDYE